MNLEVVKRQVNAVRPEIFLIFFIVVMFFHSINLSSFGVGLSSFLFHLLLAPLAAALTDIAVNFVKHKTIIKPYRAIATGLIISVIVLPGNIFFSILVPAIAILLKHAIRFNKKTVFNPAALGVLVSVLFFSAPNTWWISSFLIVPFGIFMAWKVRNLATAASFLAVYYLVSLVQGIPITISYSLFFFAFVMVIEPNTSAHAPKGKLVFGSLVGLLSALGFFYLDPFLFSLLLLNPTVYFLDQKLK